MSKNYILFGGLLLLIGCLSEGQKADTSQRVSSSIDTINIEFTKFTLTNFQVIHKWQQVLIKEETDSSLILNYYFDYPDTSSHNKFIFSLKNNNLVLIYPANEFELTGKDTIAFQSGPMAVRRYKLIEHGIDGEAELLFSKEYGMIAQTHQAWIDKLILTRWDNKKMEQEIVDVLLSDTLKVLPW